MPIMLDFFAKKTSMGIEITSSLATFAVLSKRSGINSLLFSNTVALPDGLVTQTYAAQNISDEERFVSVLREGMNGASELQVRRAALSLPDSMFRVQTLDFEQLPKTTVERDKLIRWRLEKSAFDLSDTVLRHQILKHDGKGLSVLVCLAKQAVIAQYESLLSALGLEPWSIAPSSFHSLNFYSPYLSGKADVSAFSHVSKDASTTIVCEAGAPRFYRYKEIKRGAEAIESKLAREIGDSLHYYMHLEDSQPAKLKHLFLTGDPAVCSALQEKMKEASRFDVEILFPSVVIPSVNGATAVMAAAFGAGCSL